MKIIKVTLAGILLTGILFSSCHRRTTACSQKSKKNQAKQVRNFMEMK